MDKIKLMLHLYEVSRSCIVLQFCCTNYSLFYDSDPILSDNYTLIVGFLFKLIQQSALEIPRRYSIRQPSDYRLILVRLSFKESLLSNYIAFGGIPEHVYNTFI